MQRDSILNTFKVAVLLCLVCSVVVSSLAVGLRDIQQQQKEAFRQQNILTAAGLWNSRENTKEEAGSFYKQYITPVVIDLETNKPADIPEDDKRLDPKAAARDPNWHTLVTDLGEDVRDVASIRKREHYSTIYEVREGGQLQTLVIPIRGYGLWSTLWGFIALDVTKAAEGPQAITIKGLSYYQHGETPGLGGEVENPLWTRKWPGKLVYDSDWNVRVEVSKLATTDYQVDALSGATITSNGVTSMLQFWLGEHGFGPYLKSISGSSAPHQSAPSTDPAT
ncbi:MAG: Na(+)-translocating NADH-quinone reductase subunit C [Planctomycetaceae bacterium]|jgi:Na+-transporting NADH:ubiquinone oxidoreductase subunit C